MSYSHCVETKIKISRIEKLENMSIMVCIYENCFFSYENYNTKNIKKGNIFNNINMYCTNYLYENKFKDFRIYTKITIIKNHILKENKIIIQEHNINYKKLDENFKIHNLNTKLVVKNNEKKGFFNKIINFLRF